MLLHYLWEIKVQICDKLRTRWTFSRSAMVSVGISELGFAELIFVRPGSGEDQRRLLPRHAPVTAAVAHDVRLVR